MRSVKVTYRHLKGLEMTGKNFLMTGVGMLAVVAVIGGVRSGGANEVQQPTYAD
jgi:hypothetical protein